MKTGVEVTFDEMYTSDKSSQTTRISPLFMEPVRKYSISTDFRLKNGNQAVGGAYTICREYSDDLKTSQPFLTEVVRRRFVVFAVKVVCIIMDILPFFSRIRPFVKVLSE